MKTLIGILSFVLFAQICLSQNNSFRLWGVTTSNGVYGGSGFIYSINPDGSDYQVAKAFQQNTDGAKPFDSPIKASDGYLYGASTEGGMFDLGVIYRLDADGSNYTKLHDFGLAEAVSPQGRLMEGNDGMLYGTARNPPSSLGPGVLFKINKDGSAFSIFYRFPNGTGASGPVGTLMQGSDNALYGVTEKGGLSQNGTIYKIGTDGSGVQKLRDLSIPPYQNHPFIEGPDGLLYGYLESDGVFRMAKDGSSFQVLKSIGNNSGILLMNNGKLLGLSCSGPTGASALLFSMDLDGSNYTVLYDFGAYRDKALMPSANGKLYGSAGNSVYEIGTDGGGYRPVYFVIGQNLSGSFGHTMVETSPGVFIGINDRMGASQNGMIFKLTPSGTFTSMKEFPANGMDPESPLMMASDGDLYGTTFRGGTEGTGTIFKIKKDGTGFQELHSFTGVTRYEKIQPGPLLEYNDYLYGTDERGLYKMKRDGSGFTYVKDFYSDNVGYPYGALVIDNGFIYGATSILHGQSGSLYKVDLSTGVFSVVVDFANVGNGWIPTNVGSMGAGKLIVPVWSYNYPDVAAVYTVNTDGSDIKNLWISYDLIWVSRNIPFLASDGLLYGTYFYDGLLYSMNTDGTNRQNLFPTNYRGTNGSVIEPRQGELYFHANYQIVKYTIADQKFTMLTERNDDYSYAGLLAVEKQGQTLTMDAIADRKLGDAPFMLAAQSSLDLPITFTSSDPSIVSITDNTATIVGAGQVTITAYQKGSITISDASAGRTFNVAKGDQTITFNSIAAKDLSIGSFILEGTASSGDDVIYNSLSEKISISVSSVTLKSAGRITITATQPGDNNYNAATNVDQSFCINPPKPTISVSGSTTSPILTSSNNNGNQWYLDGQAIVSATNNTLSVTHDGVYTVMTTTDDCSSVLSDVKSIIIPQAQTIVFPEIPAHVLGGAPFDLTATASSGLPVTYATTSDQISIDHAKLTMTKAGRVTITALQPGNDLYLAAQSQERSFCINPPKPGIVFVTGLATYGLTSTSDVGNQWYLNGTAIPNATSKNFVASQDGMYTVVVAVDDCTSESSAGVIVKISGLEDESSSQVTVYPNPATDEIFVKMEGQGIVAIVDATGRVIQSGADHQLDIRSLARGIYFARIEANGKLIIRSFAKL